VRSGGNVLWLLQALMADETVADLRRYGVVVGNDVVLEDNPEARMMGMDPSFLLVPPDGLDFHPVTDEINGVLLLQVARSVDVLEDAPEGLRGQVLLRSSSAAWAERSLDGSAAAPDAADIVGAVPLMVAVEVDDPAAIVVGASPPSEQPAGAFALATPGAETNDPPQKVSADRAGARLLVVGDATFPSNQLLLQGANQKLWLEAIAWLVGEERSVAIPEAKFAAGKLEMNQAQGTLVWLVSVLFFPGLALALGGAAWARRRKL
jgi:hypothetical protein